MGGNQAINVNPATGVGNSLTARGSDFLWAVFAVFGFSALVHGAFTLYHVRKYGDRLRAGAHAGPTILSTVLAATYYTMASNLGWAAVVVEFTHYHPAETTRQAFYARFIGWFLAWPALLFHFELNAEASRVIVSHNLFHVITHMLLQVSAAETMVLGLLLGAVVHTSYKWGYWTFGTVGLLFALVLLLHRQLSGGRTSTVTWIVMAFYSVCYILYPVAWGLSYGGNVISTDSEAVFFGVLDLVVFWIIPALVASDTYKNGTFVTPTPPTTANTKAESPAARASGETEVSPAALAPEEVV